MQHFNEVQVFGSPTPCLLTLSPPVGKVTLPDGTAFPPAPDGTASPPVTINHYSATAATCAISNTLTAHMGPHPISQSQVMPHLHLMEQRSHLHLTGQRPRLLGHCPQLMGQDLGPTDKIKT